MIQKEINASSSLQKGKFDIHKKTPSEDSIVPFIFVFQYTFNVLRSSSIIVMSELEKAREGPPSNNTQT